MKEIEELKDTLDNLVDSSNDLNVLIEFEEIAEDPFLRMLLSIFIARVLAIAGVILFCCFLFDSRCLWIDWTIERSSV